MAFDLENISTALAGKHGRGDGISGAGVGVGFNGSAGGDKTHHRQFDADIAFADAAVKKFDAADGALIAFDNALAFQGLEMLMNCG